MPAHMHLVVVVAGPLLTNFHLCSSLSVCLSVRASLPWMNDVVVSVVAILRLLNLTRFGLHVRFGEDLVLFPDTSLSDTAASDHGNSATSAHSTPLSPTTTSPTSLSTHCSPSSASSSSSSSSSPSSSSGRRGCWSALAATLTCRWYCCRHQHAKISRITWVVI